MKLPIAPENLPAVDHHITEAVAVEHSKSTAAMARTLRGMGWSPMEVAYVEDHWAWVQIARAVVAERLARRLVPVAPEIVAALIEDTPAAKLRAAEKAWEQEHGPTLSPRPPGPIQLPRRPATTADVSGYALSPETPQGQGERP